MHGANELILTIAWEKWTAIGTFIYAGFAGAGLIAVVIAICQLRATGRAQKLEIIGSAYGELHTDQAKADRRFIYESGLEELSDDELGQFQRARVLRFHRKEESGELTVEAVERTADMWHHVGLLADQQFVDRDLLFHYFHWPLLNCYQRMRRYIKWRQRRWNPRYGEFFVSLAGEFEDIYKKKWGADEFARVFGSRTFRNV